MLAFFDKWATINSDENDFSLSSVFPYPLIISQLQHPFSSFVLQSRDIHMCFAYLNKLPEETNSV